MKWTQRNCKAITRTLITPSIEQNELLIYEVMDVKEIVWNGLIWLGIGAGGRAVCVV